jgi:uncharacterized protein YjcR
MPPPPGYLRFVDICEHLGVSPNTVRKAERAAGGKVKPLKSGTMALYTADDVSVLRGYLRPEMSSQAKSNS